MSEEPVSVTTDGLHAWHESAAAIGGDGDIRTPQRARRGESPAARKQLDSPLDSLWSTRRGEYRAIYAIDDEQHRVSIVAVAHR